MTNFNFEQALNDSRAGKDLNGKDGILTRFNKTADGSCVSFIKFVIQ